jgi:hypothetical protein
MLAFFLSLGFSTKSKMEPSIREKKKEGGKIRNQDSLLTTVGNLYKDLILVPWLYLEVEASGRGEADGLPERESPPR